MIGQQKLKVWLILSSFVQLLAFSSIGLRITCTQAFGSPGEKPSITTSVKPNNTPAPKPTTTNTPLSIYEKTLLELKSDKAIRLLCFPLNQALAKQNYVEAAALMRMIALAFRLDENDTAAAQAVQIALKLNPEDINCRFQAAEYLLRNGNWQAGEKLYNELGQSPEKSVSLRAKAFMYQHLCKTALAIKSLEQCLEKNAEDERVLLKLANLYLSVENPEKAVLVLKRAAALSQSDYLEEIYLGRAEEAERNIGSAELHFRAAGKLNAQDPLWHCELATMHMKQQRLMEADKEFRQCFASRRMISLAYTNWAVMQAYFGSQSNAEKCLDYALQLRPHSNEILFAKAVVAEKTGKTKQALADLEGAISLNPRTSSPYTHVMQLKTTPEERLAFCRTWVSNCPDSFTAKIKFANALRATGNDDEALKNYLLGKNLIKDSEPKNRSLINICTMHANIASILYKRQDLKGALAEAIEFNALRPDTAATAGLSMRPAKLNMAKLTEKARKAAEHALLADVLYECHDLGSAVQEYRLALKDDPDNINYHSCLLKVLLDKRDYGAAANEDAAVSHHLITHIPDLFNSGKGKLIFR